MESTSGMYVSLDESVFTLWFIDFNLFPDRVFTLCCHLVSEWRLFTTANENVESKCKCQQHERIDFLITIYILFKFKDTWVWICVQRRLSACSCTQVTRNCMWVDLYRSASESLIPLDFRLPVSFQPGSLTKPLVSACSVVDTKKKELLRLILTTTNAADHRLYWCSVAELKFFLNHLVGL